MVIEDNNSSIRRSEDKYTFRNMIKCTSFLPLFMFFLILSTLCTGQQPSLETFYEKSGFKETPRYDKTIRFCKQLAQLSPWVHYTRFGMSPQGRELPLLIVDKKGNFNPQSVHSTPNAVILIQACIHAGEPDGKDAGLQLIRDMVVNKKYEELLDNLTILFIPILNVDGHERFGSYNRINQNGPIEMGWRTNAQNLNLNRDYLKAETREIKSWLALFQEWLPDFFIDCHTTDGADYQYAITYGMESSGSMDPDITEWEKQDYLKTVEVRMKESGFPIIPYVSFRNWHDPRSGLETWVSPPMFSQGYCAVQNRPSLLIETHMLKDYQTRVNATYEMIRHSLFVLNRDHLKLIDLVRESDKRTTTMLRTSPFPVSYANSDKDSVMIDFMGYEYEVVTSDLTGGNWFKYKKTPQTLKIPYFNTTHPVTLVNLPEAYIIPPEWTEVITKLNLHGIITHTLTKETRIKVSSYRFRDVNFKSFPFEGRQTAAFVCDTLSEERNFPQGSILIDMNQRQAKIIAHMLEPMASSSLVYWGYFNAVFEQKEYSESYVMEEMARQMIAKDPSLLTELNKKKEEDPKFAKSPQSILNWFYSRTPYWDERRNVYPVGKIVDRAVVEKLKN